MRTQGGKPNEIPTLIDLIKKGYFQQVRFLVDFGTTLDERDENRRTPLMLCAFIEPEKWGVGIARMLIENGARLDLRDRFGLNAFHLACIYDRVELAKVFLNAIDFNMQQGDKQGNTALHYAVKGGNAILVKLLVQILVRYGLPLEIPNNDGLTPVDEAYRFARKKIIKILENPHQFCDQENIEANLPLELGDFENEANSVFSNSRRSISRPRSSLISGRSSRLSSASTYHSWRRSPTIYNYEVKRFRKREPEREIPLNEKNSKMLIRCASISDFRNNPEYLFNAIPLEDITDMQVDGRPGSVKRIRPKSAFVRREDVKNDCREKEFTWRTEFKKLYTHFQYQCSPSYRDTVVGYGETTLPHLDKPGTPSPSEAETDDDRRRGRKSALMRQNTKEIITKGKPPPVPKVSGRRMSSQSSGHGRQMTGSVDGSLGSSSESVNSTVSSKKQSSEDKSSAGTKGSKERHGGKVEESVGTGRQSRTGNYKGLPTPTVNISMENGSTASQSSSPASADSTKLRVIDE